VNLAEVPGAGAAGGLGFGLMAFAGARLEKGFELFARYARLDKRLQDADLVITGEGAIDRSTFMGKGVGEIARRCAKLGKPCIGMAGRGNELNRLTGLTQLIKETSAGFAVMASLEDITTVEKAKLRAEVWLERLAERVAGQWGKRVGRLGR